MKKTRGPAKATAVFRQAIHEIVNERAPIPVRGVAYGLFVGGLIPDMGRNSTGKVSKVMTLMREEGVLDWRLIVDDSRRVQQAPSWSEPDELIGAMVRQYRRDYWQDQPTIIEVWAEKATVQGVLGEVIDKYGVPFRVMKGFTSFTSIKNAAVASQRANHDGKEFKALYLGDWDPSGMHMSEVDLPRRFYEYGGIGSIERIAVTEEDFGCVSFNASGKTSDTRYKWYVERYGHDCWELDAINPNDLRARVDEQIAASLDLLKWNRAIDIEAVEKESMRDFHATWGKLMGEEA